MSMEKKPRQFTFPTAFTILFILLVLIALATWVIPAGSYELDADGAPIPGTYQQCRRTHKAARQRADGADQRHVWH
ncbi:MAG: hypothetical protein H6643_10685 [Caldilineaceae bacterium]|nr:hypothetical protein [Caldilineaceae bacterium]